MKSFKPLDLILLCCLFTAPVHAAGKPEIIGQVYEIAEENPTDVILRTLDEMEQSGELAKLMAELDAETVAHMQRPEPVPGISKTSTPSTHYWDPTIEVTEDFKDINGNVVIPKGFTANPLDYSDFGSPMVFINGDDAQQVNWAKKVGEYYGWNVDFILVDGSPWDLMHAWDRQVYFDQGGFFCNKLDIRHVPAIAYQDGKRIRIDELVIPEEKEDQAEEEQPGNEAEQLGIPRAGNG